MTRPDPTTDPEVRARLHRGQRTAAANKTANTRKAVAATIDDAGPDGIQAQSIARRTGLSRSTVIRTLNALVAESAISRRPDPVDARVIRYRTLGRS